MISAWDRETRGTVCGPGGGRVPRCPGAGTGTDGTLVHTVHVGMLLQRCRMENLSRGRDWRHETNRSSVRFDVIGPLFPMQVEHRRLP